MVTISIKNVLVVSSRYSKVVKLPFLCYSVPVLVSSRGGESYGWAGWQATVNSTNKPADP